MLALIMIFVVVLLLLGAGIAALAFPEFFFINRHAAQAAALHLADAGVKEAIYRMETGNFDNFNSNLTPDLPCEGPSFGNFRVAVTADAGNASDSLVIYRITSEGSLNSHPNITKTIEAVVQGDSFAKYSSFTGQETLGNSTEKCWFRTGDVVEGPVHSNGEISVYWDQNVSGQPIFLSQVTTSDSFSYSPENPLSENDYRKIFLNGSTGFELNVAPISYPTDVTPLKLASLGAISEPNNNGVYLSIAGGIISGGIFLQGDINQVRFSVDASNNQVITINQSESITIIALNQNNNTTTYTAPNGTVTTYNGLPNGVIFGTGHIADLSGIINSRITLVTDNKNTNNFVNITNDLVYAQDPRTHPEYTACLGIVAPDITIDDNAPSEININAAIMASDTTGSHGSFSVKNYSSIPVKGHINLLGGVIQHWRGAVGTTWLNDGSIRSGYLKNYHQDIRFQFNPPPYFPTTGKYTVRFWKVLQ